jgi:transcriptional regulator of acetoin/glycerol metabolism
VLLRGGQDREGDERGTASSRPRPDGASGRRRTRIERFERDEITRVLSRPGTSVRQAAEELGMSRATVYRKIAQHDLHLQRL